MFYSPSTYPGSFKISTSDHASKLYARGVVLCMVTIYTVSSIVWSLEELVP